VGLEVGEERKRPEWTAALHTWALGSALGWTVFKFMGIAQLIEPNVFFRAVE
jgi:hypothetical protein